MANIKIFAILSSLLPALLWLFFYLRYDPHPEPKNKILKAFLGGSLMVLVALFLETQLAKLLIRFLDLPIVLFYLQTILLAPWIEELLKIAIVYPYVFSSSLVDEPLDIVMYFVSSGLGFAFLESFLKVREVVEIYTIAEINAWRFVASVLLHSQTMLIFSLFLVLSFYLKPLWRRLIQIIAFLLAVLWHGLYNLSIFMAITSPFVFVISVITMFSVLFVLSFYLKKLKDKKGVCTIY